MKRTTYTLIILFLCILFNCAQPESKTSITTSLDLDGSSEFVVLSESRNGILDSLSTNGTSDITLDSPKVLWIRAGNKSGNVYITPGSNITILSDENNLYYEGDFSNENNMLTHLTHAMSSQSAIMNLWDIAHFKEEDFLKKIANKQAKFDSIVGTIEDINPSFKTLIDKRINAHIAYEKMQYPHYHQILTQDTLKLSSGYENYLDDLNINDPDLLHFYEGQQIIKAIVEKDVDFMKSGGQYYNILFDKVDQALAHQAVKEYLWKEYLVYYIGNGVGIDYADNMLRTFAIKNNNKAYQKEVDALVETWDDLRKGKKAPQFSGLTSKGDIIALKDFIGKNVYVDVWATWCGPCIAEIPYLKQIEHEYKDKNIEFISVSIDNKRDKEKWINFVAEKELGGTQIMAANDWKSEIVSSYNILGIPRFILIDAEGKIISANAPRPSYPELKHLLNTL
ncbi:TlpA family protein disulfide reductase [Winogradskyella flava]|uniref:TlpA family protein disulfide reductase n=1 Tax=Winogradskyella flava TaxID=1884876 RepID=UPI0024906EA5|nr:TlpA disulfide reductase family protein [Winogradskyella flava]